MVAMIEAFDKKHAECALGEKGLTCHFCFKFGHKPFDCPKLNYEGNPERWWEGPDTGASSKALWRVLRGLDRPGEARAYPHDADDFGRCQRLLKAIPGWRERIGEMALAPGWGKLVEHWDELEKLYDEEFPGVCTKLYAKLKELGV
jgi:hypothetical protein